MTEPTAPGGETAGGLLRAAREARGMHIAALAAAIKVTPHKLDALEGNRWEELPDATFARALAQAVCRTLKIDPRPVLDLLPAVKAGLLENAKGGLNMPFASAGSVGEGSVMGAAVKPLVWSAVALLLAALVVFFMPLRWLPVGLSGPAGQPASAPLFPARTASGADGLPEPAAPAAEAGAVDAAASSAATPASAVPEPAGAAMSAAPASGPALQAAGVLAPAAAGDGLLIQTSGESWIEVRDASGRVLLSRLVTAGEQLTGLQGALPLRLVIGNAGAVRVNFRQQTVDLTPVTRENVARLQLPLP
jgi:cytoskeleton protein RodZ